ncbi:adenylyltransferase/cytidyltransferase family protein [[Haemophilus] felis]|nr:adenylyltransferase/cytidyltransferase family protein [[Haemophilus] felis]
MKKKVFVSGCYDMLHSGHIAFFEQAAKLGDLYVGIGSDKTIESLKKRKTINPEQERLYMVKALRAVKDAWVNSGSGLLDFEQDLRTFRPDVFFVNEDGHSPEKEKLCAELGIEYLVSQRVPHQGLPVRSTTVLRQECHIPYRIDLAGGWLDQPEVSKYASGPVITVCIEPDYEFNDRSGMSTSTRKKALELWQTDIPEGDKVKLAKTLFCYENSPGSQYVSGSQDALGIVLPAVNYLWYEGDYWPSSIQSEASDEVLDWLEKHLQLIALSPRAEDLYVAEGASINTEKVQHLSDLAQQVWQALLAQDLTLFAETMTKAFQAQVALYPNMMNDTVREGIAMLPKEVLGYKLCGAGGGGYLAVVSETPLPQALKIRIRRA